MGDSKKARHCPHCDAKLQAIQMPDNSGWENRPQWVCFNDSCPYYCEGWEWMQQNYNVRASYRYRVVDLETGCAQPIAVWSETALLDRILENEEP